MTDTYRPRNLAEVVGQRDLKARLQVLVDGAMLTRALPHMLFTGPPGTGKTSIAEVLAYLTGDDMHKLTMPVDIKQLERLVRYETGVFVLDELHKASALVQARLMVLMEHGYLPTASGEDIWPVQAVTIIGATTNAEKIDAALYDRFLVPIFEPYSPEDMAAIVAGMSAKAGITLGEETAAALGRAATGSPRCALRLVEAAEALTSARYGIEPDLESILHQAGFAADGLTELHLIYLESLLDFDGAGLAAFARYLRLHPTVVMDLERLLRRQHLVEFSGSGRRITQAGRRRIAERLSERVAA